MASKRFRETVGIDPDRVVSAAIEAALGDAQPRRKQRHPGRVLAAGAAVAAAAAVGQRRMPRLVKVPMRMGLNKLGGKLGDMAHVDDLTGALRDRLAGREQEPDDLYDDEELDDEQLDDEELDDEELDDEELDDEPRDVADDQLDDEDEDEGFDDDDGFDDEPEDDDGPRGEGDEEEPDAESPEDEPDDEVDDGPEDERPDDEELDDEPAEDDEDLLEDEPSDTEDDEDDEEIDDDQVAARGLDLGVGRSPRRRGQDSSPDLFEALRTPQRRAPVMRSRTRRIDPATRPPVPGDIVRRNRARSRANKAKSRSTRAQSTATRA
jgi:hypothetical protein